MNVQHCRLIRMVMSLAVSILGSGLMWYPLNIVIDLLQGSFLRPCAEPKLLVFTYLCVSVTGGVIVLLSLKAFKKSDVSLCWVLIVSVVVVLMGAKLGTWIRREEIDSVYRQHHKSSRGFYHDYWEIWTLLQDESYDRAVGLMKRTADDHLLLTEYETVYLYRMGLTGYAGVFRVVRDEQGRVVKVNVMPGLPS